jgi:hypothetical protein
MNQIENVLKQDKIQMFMNSTDNELMEALDINFLRVTLARLGMLRSDINQLSHLEMISIIREKLQEDLD